MDSLSGETRSAKRCSKCRQYKPETEFYWDSATLRYRSRCKVCYLDAARLARNPTRRRPLGWGRERRQCYIDDYLRAHPCVDCGEADPVVLQFDHVEDDGNNCSVHAAMRNRTIIGVKREIAKCEIRCANCHIRRHAQLSGRSARFTS